MPGTERNRSVFITGGTGFIGRHVLAALRREGWSNVTCLTRQLPPSLPSSDPDPGWKYLLGDLAHPETYASSLAGVDVVVHLAAATGSASNDALRRINVEATAMLLQACESQGVRHILYVSSIAAKYRDLEGYAYGQSKVAAEAAVRQSGLEYTILRPTIVLGTGSPIWQKLRTLATAPLIVVFGSGQTRVQPVDVEDVARGILAILRRFRFASEVIELGGPEVLTFESLMRRIRAASRGGNGQAPIARLPVSPLRHLLKIAGVFLGAKLPISPGQLSPFLNDGVADPSDLATELKPQMRPLDTLLQRLASVR
ncbi:MAG: NAD-dependent epimerase/dehydratase family protein [Gemmatimonadota bacterium]